LVAAALTSSYESWPSPFASIDPKSAIWNQT
jgi:hypothetical protein